MKLNENLSSDVKYRAQLKSIHGHWVDGGLFTNRAIAEAEAIVHHERYGLPVRVIEVPVDDRGLPFPQSEGLPS